MNVSQSAFSSSADICDIWGQSKPTCWSGGTERPWRIPRAGLARAGRFFLLSAQSRQSPDWSATAGDRPISRPDDSAPGENL